MISTTTVISPESAAEAYDAYHSTDSAILVAGAQEINKREGHYDLAIHLRNAGLDYIEDRGDEIAIGAMTTMREIETSSLLKELAGGVIVECLKEFGDTGLKSKATIGGLIALKKPASLLIPILLALTTDVLLEGKGRMDLNDYLYCPPMGEMIKEVIIQKNLYIPRIRFVNPNRAKQSISSVLFLCGMIIGGLSWGEDLGWHRLRKRPASSLAIRGRGQEKTWPILSVKNLNFQALLIVQKKSGDCLP